MNQKNELIKRFGIMTHLEGGAFAESYCLSWLIDNQEGEQRAASTRIYFLLGQGEFSAFHRLSCILKTSRFYL